MDEVQYEESLDWINRLMAAGKLTKGQELYLETLVQLVQAYEAAHHPIDAAGLHGLDALRQLLANNDMNASELEHLAIICSVSAATEVALALLRAHGPESLADHTNEFLQRTPG
ncbi:MAG: hypothetical protein ABFD92_18115, partial [Planctomycetaceae bacterium]